MQKQIQKDFQQTLTFFLFFLFSHDDSRFQKMASNMVRIPSTTNSKICKKILRRFSFLDFSFFFMASSFRGCSAVQRFFPFDAHIGSVDAFSHGRIA